MADKRYYVKMDVGYLDNPKVAPLVESHPRSVLLHMWAIMYSRMHGTDGLVPVRLGMRHVCIGQCGEQCGEQCKPQCDLLALMQTGLLEAVESTTIPQAFVHDYLEHQESSESVKAASDKARRAAAARWGDAQGNASSNASSNASGNAVSNASSNAKERRGEERKTDDIDPLFDDFWSIYPRKVAKATARKSWATATRKAEPANLIAAASVYAISTANSEARFVKHPATWLNSECWLDEQPTVAANPDGWMNR